jgi:hypothetical protein
MISYYIYILVYFIWFHYCWIYHFYHPPFLFILYNYNWAFRMLNVLIVFILNSVLRSQMFQPVYHIGFCLWWSFFLLEICHMYFQYSTGFWTLDLTLSHCIVLFSDGFCHDRVSWTIGLGWLLMSASSVARITGVSPRHLALYIFFGLFLLDCLCFYCHVNFWWKLIFFIE